MIIAGIDEAGRGPLAGPVVAAAVVLPNSYTHQEICDSKKLSAKKREKLFEVIKEVAVDWAIAEVGPRYIDAFNIREATKRAMEEVAHATQAEQLLIDGNMPIGTQKAQTTVIGGDAKHLEISAASILAKVWRDRIMKSLDIQHPGYGLAKHAGYPTKFHKEAIVLLGPSPIHRFSFRGVSEHMSQYPAAIPEANAEALERDVFVFSKHEITSPRVSVTTCYSATLTETL